MTGLDLTDHMFVNDEIKCVTLSQTTVTNASFRNMIFTGSTFIETRLTNSDFSSSRAYGSLCNGGNEIGVNFMDALSNAVIVFLRTQKLTRLI